jgi:hypothetical protein
VLRLNALKKLEARIEVGVNYLEYSRVVGETWGEVKVFIESPDGKSLSEFNELLTRAVNDYKMAMEIWQNKIKYSSLFGHNTDVDVLRQAYWARASMWTGTAELILDPDKIEEALKEMPELLDKEDTLQRAWKETVGKILKR